MQWRSALLAALSTGLLAGCEVAGPDRVETTNPSVSFEFEGDEELESATEQAEDYCERFDLEARLLDIDERDEEDDIAVFACD